MCVTSFQKYDFFNGNQNKFCTRDTGHMNAAMWHSGSEPFFSCFCPTKNTDWKYSEARTSCRLMFCFLTNDEDNLLPPSCFADVWNLMTQNERGVFLFFHRDLRSNMISLIEPGAFLGLPALKRLWVVVSALLLMFFTHSALSGSSLRSCFCSRSN